MKLTGQERQAIIQQLTTNCEAWKSPGDDQILNSFTDEKLLAIKDSFEQSEQAVAVANAAVNGFSDGETAYRINPDTGKWERRQVENVKKKMAPPEDDDDEEDDDEDEDYMPKRKVANVATDIRQRPRTVEDWFRNAPAEVQEERRVAQAIVNRQKDEVISQLLANVSEADRPAHRERLQQRSLDDLHNDLSLLPKAPTQDEIERAAGTTTNRRKTREQPDSDMLAMPTMNWKPVDDSQKTQVANEVVEVESDGGDSYEEWLKKAPPNVRQVVQNATIVEARERRKLIDQIVANFNGTDEQESQLVQSLERKSISELSLLLGLTPTREQPKPNYFGKSTPLAANARTSDSAEDVLPLPQMDWKAKAN